MAPPKKRGKRYLLMMSVGALGIVYGDIGTSPLYAFRESFHAAEGMPVDRASVLGVLSLMFWALVLVVSVKYLIFVMRADNHGEGGILALTALIVPRRKTPTVGLRWALILLGLFGTALLYGDGIITPAISVLSAVEGLEIVEPDLESYVVPIAVVILIALFSIQRAGHGSRWSHLRPGHDRLVHGARRSRRLPRDPGPGGARCDQPGVRSAVSSPTTPRLAFLALGSIFLVVTGAEALYADMGHFGKRPIRFGWYIVVFPALLLNYFGQGAMLIADPGAIDNPFFRMPPEWAVLPLVILATMATVIASQALISGAYSLTMQAVQLGYLPRFDIDHTSPQGGRSDLHRHRQLGPDGRLRRAGPRLSQLEQPRRRVRRCRHHDDGHHDHPPLLRDAGTLAMVRRGCRFAYCPLPHRRPCLLLGQHREDSRRGLVPTRRGCRDLHRHDHLEDRPPQAHRRPEEG